MIPEDLEGHPPSDKLLYLVVEEHGPAPLDEIATQARLPKSTASTAMQRLYDADLTDYQPSPTSPRQKVWFSI